jgi:arginine utilization protein RocB
MDAVTRTMANVIVLMRMFPFMNENSFLSLARTANRASLKQTVPRYQINHFVPTVE